MVDPYKAAEEFAEEFRQMEYALKRSGYLHRKKYADADWDRFAQELGSDFFSKVSKSGIAKTLIEHPSRQLLADMTWVPENPPPLTNVAQLIINGLCRVRNSYLHGEKFTGGPDPDQWQRDAVLIEEAHVVLKEAKSHLTSTLKA